jgi:hypothetical protein
MPCKPCREKRIQLYLSRGMNRQDAERRADKIMPLIEKRLEKRLQRQPRFKVWLRRIVFHTNWRASFFWSFKFKKLFWVGLHGSDYTQACTQVSNGSCTVSGTTCKTTQGSCGCPSPLANSSLVTSCGCSTPTLCTYHSGACTLTKECPNYTCGYNCNSGYHWNGSACVPIVSGKTPFSLKIGGVSIFTAILDAWARIEEEKKRCSPWTSG